MKPVKVGRICWKGKIWAWSEKKVKVWWMMMMRDVDDKDGLLFVLRLRRLLTYLRWPVKSVTSYCCTRASTNELITMNQCPKNSYTVRTSHVKNYNNCWGSTCSVSCLQSPLRNRVVCIAWSGGIFVVVDWSNCSGEVYDFISPCCGICEADGQSHSLNDGLMLIVSGLSRELCVWSAVSAVVSPPYTI